MNKKKLIGTFLIIAYIAIFVVFPISLTVVAYMNALKPADPTTITFTVNIENTPRYKECVSRDLKTIKEFAACLNE